MNWLTISLSTRILTSEFPFHIVLTTPDGYDTSSDRSQCRMLWLKCRPIPSEVIYSQYRDLQSISLQISETRHINNKWEIWNAPFKHNVLIYCWCVNFVRNLNGQPNLLLKNYRLPCMKRPMNNINYCWNWNTYILGHHLEMLGLPLVHQPAKYHSIQISNDIIFP